MKLIVTRDVVPIVAALVLLVGGTAAQAQVVYYGGPRPVVAAPVVAAPVVAAPIAVAPAYVANYTPAGNYAAVTAFSPPLVAEPAAVAVRSAYAPVVAAPVTAYYPGALYRRGPLGVYRPVRTAYYIPY